MILGSTANIMLNLGIMRQIWSGSLNSLWSTVSLTIIIEWLGISAFTYAYYFEDVEYSTLLPSSIQLLQMTSQLGLFFCLDLVTVLKPHLWVHLIGIVLFNAVVTMDDFAYNFQNRLPKQTDRSM